MEALSRLKGVDLATHPALQTAVMKMLEARRGTPDFVKIVQDFKITGLNPGLLEVAVKHPAEDSGVAAMRLILASGDVAVVQAALTNHATPDLPDGAHGAGPTDDSLAIKTAMVLGNTGEKQMVPLLLPLVADSHLELALRKQAVKSLAQNREGAAALLQLAGGDKLPGDLKFLAGAELNSVRWPELKAEAARLLPLPRGRNSQPLPPVAELLKMPGNAPNGERVFFRPETGCVNCHCINGRGADVGPALSEIGAKMGRDALYEAILDPSAGIAFGYETWQMELKSGDEAYGIITSETAEELAVKDSKGIITHLKKGEIASRRQLKLSLMPAGLQQTMTTQELVDLVEYLSTLKKAEKGGGR